jgi:hypothetical protein
MLPRQAKCQNFSFLMSDITYLKKHAIKSQKSLMYTCFQNYRVHHRQLNYSKTSHCYPIFGNTIPARREQLAELIL